MNGTKTILTNATSVPGFTEKGGDFRPIWETPVALRSDWSRSELSGEFTIPSQVQVQYLHRTFTEALRSLWDWGNAGPKEGEAAYYLTRKGWEAARHWASTIDEVIGGLDGRNLTDAIRHLTYQGGYRSKKAVPSCWIRKITAEEISAVMKKSWQDEALSSREFAIWRAIPTLRKMGKPCPIDLYVEVTERAALEWLETASVAGFGHSGNVMVWVVPMTGAVRPDDAWMVVRRRDPEFGVWWQVINGRIMKTVRGASYRGVFSHNDRKAIQRAFGEWMTYLKEAQHG